jgi:protein-tyrosine phosphatase
LRRGEWRFGVAFSGVGIALIAFSLWVGIWWLFLWPAISLFVVSAGYLWGTAYLFGKRHDGARSILASMVLLPYTIVAHVVWRAQCLLIREVAYHVVNDELIVARRLFGHEMPDHVEALLDLTSEFRDPSEIQAHPGYRCLPILDGGSISAEELVPALRNLRPSPGKRVLIHCANGHGRTGMAGAAWLILHGYATTAEEAVATLKHVRPGVMLKMGQWEVVRAIELAALNREDQRTMVTSSSRD